MSDLRPRGIPIVLDGVERHLLFTLNIIDELQDKYGKTIHDIIDELTRADVAQHTLRDIVTVLLNDEARREERKGRNEKYPMVTERDVGDMIGMDNYYQITAAILLAYGISLPEPEDEDPNPESGPMSS